MSKVQMPKAMAVLETSEHTAPANGGPDQSGWRLLTT